MKKSIFKYPILGLIAWVALVTVACDRPQRIPDQTLGVIMREALISQAVVQNSGGNPKLQPLDSLDLQSRVLDRHGYDMEDLRFTVREMAMRKSNPLGNILTQVAADIKIASRRAEVRYKIQLQVDSVAQARTADTVFRSDTVLRGRMDGYKFTYSGQNPRDSMVLPGTYRIEFDYSTGAHAGSYTKSVRTKRVADGGIITDATLWIPVAKDTTLYRGDIVVRGRVKEVSVSFNEVKRPDARPDTCYVAGVRLVHILPVEEAREQYYIRLTGLKPIEELSYERYFDSLQKRGGSLPPRLER